MRLNRALAIPLMLCLSLQIVAQNGARAPISEMRSVIERYTVDRGSLARSYPVAVSRARRELRAEGFAPDRVRIERLVDVR